eukprot:TRINITY_DN9089_c0_g1_i1.p1 TRINITY_DN9089_c0_g1~~TRINITY_DN9089_c0_g1_i1.p1  ORF type:complete len:364 (-),score=43.42 TRINITY_DN9089_c0_g1_i1:46-1137(-)
MFLAHFNTNDPFRPSFFEMIAQYQLMPTLRPALKYLFTVLAQRDPRWEWVVHHYDSLFYSCLLVMEHHYLEYNDGSFSENFYGLKRVRVGTQKKDQTFPLSNSDRYWSLFFLVGLPYLKSKADQYYLQSTDQLHPWSVPASSEEGSSTEPPPAKTFLRKTLELLKHLFKLGYPIFNAIYEGSLFIYQLLYLYDHIKYYTPWLHFLGLKVQRLATEDMILQEQNTLIKRAQVFGSIAGYSPLKIFSRFLLSSYYFILDYSHYLLPAALFFFKFLEWWYAENRSPQPSLPTPPPPEPPKRTGIDLPKEKTKCAICCKDRTNPAMIGSGYVFCYPCIFNYVTTHNECPVTKLPTNVSHIKKLYEPT